MLLVAAGCLTVTGSGSHRAGQGASGSPPRPGSAVDCRLLKKNAQYVVISFDGSPGEALIEFSVRNPGIHFTFFLSGIRFVTTEYGRVHYQQPRRPKGRSNIGFGGGEAQVRAGKRRVLRALELGHEMGSHFNGHFHGASVYTEAEWGQELDWFERQTLPWIRARFPEFRFRGVRAPFLENSPTLQRVLKRAGYSYDASSVTHRALWPRKTAQGIYDMALDIIYLDQTRYRALAMDYNIHEAHRGNRKWGRAESEAWMGETYRGLQRLFESRYRGKREPIQIAGHIPGAGQGIYNAAFLRFAAAVCGKRNVHCTTYRTFVEHLDRQHRCVPTHSTSGRGG